MNSEEKIIDMVAMVYREFDITDVPIDCEAVIISLGYKLIPYSALSSSKQRACIRISSDAFISGSAIFYNDCEIPKRIRFSLMHELGHALLGHKAGSPEEEHEADTFASWMLVPRVGLCLCDQLTTSTLSERYDVSLAAAGYVLRDYPDWLHRASDDPYPGERVLAEQLSVQRKMALKEEAATYKQQMLREGSEKRTIIRLDPFIPKSRTIKGQLREISKRKCFLKALADRYDLDLPELLMEQQRVNYYYGYGLKVM